MTTAHKQKLSPWEVVQLNSRGKWVLVSSFRNRVDADQYAQLLRQTSVNPVEVVFNNA